jgi:hypothetical protein
MSQIVEFELESGGVVYVEGERGSSGQSRPAGMGKKAVEKASETFESALERVKPAAKAVVEAFRELNEPDEIGLEFGIQFKTSVDAYVLTGEGNAAFKLSLKWKKA